jgi:hypothetical protein
VGYDLATGLGSVQVNNLVNKWSSVTFKPSNTALTLSPLTNITHGSAVTVGITVAPKSGTGTPSGDVSLLSNASTTSTGGQSVDRFTLANGTVASTTHSLPGGTNTITAHYAGDATFAPSDSTSVQVTVNPEPSATTVSVFTVDATGLPALFTSTPYGSFIYLRADVAGHSGFGTPTGQVNFYDNTAELTGFTLNSQGNGVTPNGSVQFAPGSHSITATYLGDQSYQPSNPSAAVDFTITKAPTTTTLQASANTIRPSSAATFTAIVSATGGGNPPSGTVAFFNGGTQISPNVFLVPGVSATPGTVQSTTTFATSALPNGQNSMTAQYVDDSNYVASTSVPITITVAPGFTPALSSQIMTVANPGASGSLTLTITGDAGYNGTISLLPASCAGLPFGAVCTFSPASITGSGSTTLTVTTLAPHLAETTGPVALNLWIPGAGLALAGVVVGTASRKRRWSAVIGLLILAGIMTLGGCSGGGGGGGGSPGTPVGTFSVTVTTASPPFSYPVGFNLVVK